MASTVRCGSQTSKSVCDSITSQPDGIRLGDCANGVVSLDDIRYDRNGAKLSYDFIVTCHGRTAHGTWTRAGDLTCIEASANLCKPGGVCTPTSDDDCRS